MLTIPKQLQKTEYKFIKIDAQTKIPCEKNWQIDKNYIWNDEQLQQWINKGGNVAIINKHGNLLVIDCDCIEIEEIIKKSDLPETFTMETSLPEKQHIYYICNNMTKTKLYFKEPYKGDIRFTDSNFYTMIPPSIHPTGVQYKVKKDLSIAEITEEKILDVFKNVIKTTGKYEKPSLKGIDEGNRDNTLFKTACDLRKANVTYNDALEFCFEKNKNNNPPLEEEQVLKCVNSAYNYHEETKGKEQKLIDLGIAETNGKGNIICINHVKLAEYLMQSSDYHFTTLKETTETYYYENGYYHKGGEGKIKQLTYDYLGIYTTEQLKREVYGIIRDATLISQWDIIDKTNYVCLKNGTWNITTGELLPHSPDYMFFNQIKIKYDKDAKCPQVEKFFNDVFEGDKKKIDTIQELFGYCLYRGYDIQKIFFFWGEGENGKSKTGELLTHLLGMENVSAVELCQLLEDRFSASLLFKKNANIASEPKEKSITTTEVLKKLRGEDLITAQFKGKPLFQFINYAKMIYIANQFPRVKDRSHAFWRSIFTIKFERKFEKKDRDLQIMKKLTTPEELEGLLKFSLEGLNRLGDNGEFTLDETREEIEKFFREHSEPLTVFADRYLLMTDNSEDKIKQGELKDIYNKWAKIIKEQPIDENSLTRNLKKILPNIKITRKTEENQRYMVYECVRWNELAEGELFKQEKSQGEKCKEVYDFVYKNPVKVEVLYEKFEKSTVDYLLKKKALDKLPDGRIGVI